MLFATLDNFFGITNDVITIDVVKIIYSKRSRYDLNQKNFCIKVEINLRKCRFGVFAENREKRLSNEN